MKSKSNRGFTLVELMVVVAIIGICCAIVVPRLVEHKRTSDLSNLVNMVQQTVAEARNLALQTRRATVVVVSGSTKRISVNTLSGPKCGDGASQSGMAAFEYSADPYQSSASSAAMCGALVSIGDGTSCGHMDAGTTFQLCYSGSGELYFLSGSGWVRSCVCLPASCDDEGNPSGVVLRFNRFGGGASPSDCSAGALDVTRAVYAPAGGAPYSKVDL